MNNHARSLYLQDCIQSGGYLSASACTSENDPENGFAPEQDDQLVDEGASLKSQTAQFFVRSERAFG
ncbi:hypothetical protein KFU94_44675 [Chloroflexi bacterium TSY]|nr:hypothetical protein [Chloroflexi bacterium TSY]